MDEKLKNRVSQEWWMKTARLHRPEEIRRLRDKMRQARERLFAALGERKDGGELVDVFRDLIANCYAFAHYTGLRRGYLIANKQFRSDSAAARKAKSGIARLLAKHPEWTIVQVFTELDRADQPFYRLQTVPKDVRCWSDVAREPSYKMLVLRVKERMRAERRVHGWKKLMRRHQELRRKTPSQEAN